MKKHDLLAFRERERRRTDWEQRRKALENEEKDFLRAWDKDDKPRLAAIARLLVGWSKENRQKLMFQLRIPCVLRWGFVTVMVEPYKYSWFGFDGSPDSCQVWKNTHHIHRDMETIQSYWSDWFVMSFQHDRVKIGRYAENVLWVTIEIREELEER
jgi:hypothetical protein